MFLITIVNGGHIGNLWDQEVNWIKAYLMDNRN